MMKILLIALMPLLMLFGIGNNDLTSAATNKDDGNTGTLQKMIAANGTAILTLDTKKAGGIKVAGRRADGELKFDVERDSFFTILVFNNELRGPLPSSMKLIPQNSPSLSGKFATSLGQLMIENTSWGGDFELVVKDAKTGFVYFNIEGQQLSYDAGQKLLAIDGGRVLLSKEYAAELGRSSEAGSTIGTLSIAATMEPIEITEFVNGEVKSDIMPSLTPENGSVPGPDVMVGDLSGLAQFGSSSGSQVGLAVGTDSCNFGNVDLDWFALPSNDHPVIPQNLYRMSGGANGDERFEQIGQSNVKHAFTALTNNICSLGCNGVGGTHLGSGCSDPYSASLNAGPDLGSRAWINPFTGAYPRGDSPTNPNSHSGHSHTGTSHRILTEIGDLNTQLNSGAKYYAEAQYITPHEYVWCQSHPGQCNMYNNVSYRQYNVIGTGSPFTFSPVASTVRGKSAISAWPNATSIDLNPDPGIDGIGQVVYKVTNTSPGVWHYEYAVYNQNLDRGIQSFSVPIGLGAVVSNIGFHDPPQQPGWAFDGTVNNAGYSSADWAIAIAGSSVTWSSETFAQNPNANAIRWGTLYNFRFDSDRPPTTVSATVGFYKTGNPINIQVQGPSATNSSIVAISGRLLTSNRIGIGNVKVALNDSVGNTIAFATTTSFGFYTFNVVPNRTYSIEPNSKRYIFASRTVVVGSSDVGNVDILDESNQ